MRGGGAASGAVGVVLAAALVIGGLTACSGGGTRTRPTTDTGVAVGPGSGSGPALTSGSAGASAPGSASGSASESPVCSALSALASINSDFGRVTDVAGARSASTRLAAVATVLAKQAPKSIATEAAKYRDSVVVLRYYAAQAPSLERLNELSSSDAALRAAGETLAGAYSALTAYAASNC